MNNQEAREQKYEELGYWQPYNFGDRLRQWATRFSHNKAIIDKQGVLTYHEFNQNVDNYVSHLYHLGLRKGDRVLVQLPNNRTFIVICFALFRLGVIPILTTMAHRQHDLESICQQGQPQGIITTKTFMGFNHAKMAQDLAEKHQSIQFLIIDRVLPSGNSLDSIAEPISATAYSAPNYRDIAFLLLSGGTTGAPKLIPRTHTDYAYFSMTAATVCRLNEDSVYLAVLPASHNFTLGCPGILGTFSVGGCVVLAETPDSVLCFDLIEKHQVTITSLVPAIVSFWLTELSYHPHHFTSLSVLQIGGARLNPLVAEQIPRAFNCKLQQVFGMAEGLVCLTSLDDTDEVIYQSQGYPLSIHDEIKIVDPQGQNVAMGEIGELLVRGPYTIRQYYQAPEHTLHSFTDDGYYCSGDLVRLTPQGYLVVEGRIKEQINRAGEKIATAEIEDILCKVPHVHDAALLALPDDILGEQSCAMLIADQRLTLAELHQHFKLQGIARYKWPDRVEYIAQFPLTKIGKVDKQQLVRMVLCNRDTNDKV